MRTSWPVARIFGIEIRIDSSWVIIFGLVTWALAGHYFPRQYPGWQHWQYWLVGVTASVLLFGSVLAHELTHSLVARSQGEGVRSITLFIFGGVAEINEEPKTPWKEFIIAAVGPLSSLIIAFIFGVLWFLSRGVSVPIAALSRYLSMINVFLAIFNMVPGFPLDGGRVLRAIAWKATGNLRRATRIASISGQAVAFLLIFLGIWQILSGLFFNGLWIALIGWFIHSAAVRGYRQVLVKELLKDVRAEDLMSREFATVPGDLSVQALMDDHILKRRERAFLVTEEGRVSGIICLEDVKAVAPEERTQTQVRQVMTPRDRLTAVSPDDDGSQVLAKLSSGQVHQVPVVDNGTVKGIVCRSDILNFLHLRSELGV